VYLLTDSLSPQQVRKLIGLAAPRANVAVLRRRSFAAFRAYLTAAVVLFTHGIFHNPKPPAGKVVVNLWHGDGPKANPTTRENAAPLCSFVVSGSKLFGVEKCRYFGLGDEQLILTGNPRCDQFSRPAQDAQLAALGIDPRSPFVMALPTYRKAKAVGQRAGWSDLGGAPKLIRGERLHSLRTIAQQRGIQVVVKPHPMDAENYDSPGVTVLSAEDLARVELGLYQVLARAGGLVTDYSSVWVDYLTQDRPLAFLLDDIAEYSAGRGLSVEDLDSILPGPVLTSYTDYTLFLDSVGLGAVKDPYESVRAKSAEAIGLIRSDSFAESLVRELVRRGVFRGDDGRILVT
jgi:hypothetical protein